MIMIHQCIYTQSWESTRESMSIKSKRTLSKAISLSPVFLSFFFLFHFSTDLISLSLPCLDEGDAVADAIFNHAAYDRGRLDWIG